MNLFLCFVIFVETFLLFISGYYLYKWGKIILNLEDSIEDCLEALDQRQLSIEKVLQIPLFYDSPEVRRVHEDIKSSRDAILKVAYIVSRVEEVEILPSSSKET